MLCRSSPWTLPGMQSSAQFPYSSSAAVARSQLGAQGLQYSHIAGQVRNGFVARHGSANIKWTCSWQWENSIFPQLVRLHAAYFIITKHWIICEQGSGFNYFIADTVLYEFNGQGGCTHSHILHSQAKTNKNSQVFSSSYHFSMQRRSRPFLLYSQSYKHY
jgi:hypothetical protein